MNENPMIVDTNAQVGAAIIFGRMIVVITIVVHMTVGQVTEIEIEVERMNEVGALHMNEGGIVRMTGVIQKKETMEKITTNSRAQLHTEKRDTTNLTAILKKEIM